MKLKTLNDFGFVQGEEEALKGEAIKWYKEIYELQKKSHLIESAYFNLGKIDFIVKFFNLKEADLKEIKNE